MSLNLIRFAFASLMGLLCLAGRVDVARAAAGDEGWWGEYDQSKLWWTVQSVTTFEGDLVIGGDFWSSDYQVMGGALRRQGDNWVAMTGGLTEGLNDLSVIRGNLVGLTGRHDGPPLPGALRRWNGSTWTIVAGQPASIARILESESGRLLVVTADQLHEWDGEAWTEFGPAGSFTRALVEWDGGVAVAQPNGQVTLVREAGLVPLGTPGGPVTLLGRIDDRLVRGVRLGPGVGWDIDIGQIQAWNGTDWEAMGSSFERPATHLLVGPEGPEILCQREYGVGQLTRRWDGSEWTPTGVWFDYPVFDWEDIEGRRVAAGYFWVADGCTARGLAIDDGAGYRPVRAATDPVGGADLPVYALLGFRNQVVVGGTFITIGATASPFLAIGDGREWSSLGEGVDDMVLALTEFNGDLIVAGDFRTAGGLPAARIARWDGSRWHAMGDGLDGTVRSLATFDGKLYAGGDFKRSGTKAARRLAVWDGSTWSSVGEFDGPVYALTGYQGHLYAGGLFRQVNGSPCAYLARQDGSNWTQIGRLTGAVLSLTPHDGKLAIGGQMRWFSYGDGSPSLVLWDGHRMHWLPPRGYNYDDGLWVNAMVSTPLGLVVGGRGYGSPLESLARWNGTAWEPFGSGIDGTVNAMATVNGSLFIGGDFRSAGGRPSERLARWDDVLVPAAVNGVTVDRDESEVRLSWSVAGFTNLSALEMWVAPAGSNTAERPPVGQGTMLGTVPAVIGGGRLEFTDSSPRPDGARYWLRQLGPFASESWSGPYALAPLPPGARIQSIGPNPFFSATEVHYTLEHAGAVRIEVFDTQGRRIRVLQNGDQPAGVFSIEWDGRSEMGTSVVAGTYWVRLAARDGIQSRRIIRLN